MSQSEDRSGNSPEWVRGLTPITPEQCQAYVDSLMEIDLKLCDTPGCEQVAIYRVNFHGCAQHAWCGLHRVMSASGIEQVIRHHGSIICEKCNVTTYDLKATMRWFPI